MAFYALWKWFRPWSKRRYPDMIQYYNNLMKTPEQKAAEDKEARTVLAELATVHGLIGALGTEYL